MFKIWFIALCLDCGPYFPMPFETPELRDAWAEGHRTTGHRVETGFEIEHRDPRSCGDPRSRGE